MKIVVLSGGLSTERDVSFKTGERVTAALRERGHQVILLDVYMGFGEAGQSLDGIFDRTREVSVQVSDIPEVAPDLEKVKAARKDSSAVFFGPNVIELCRKADVVFMALHGENGENGRLQAAFDLFGIRYTGTGYLGSALAMDKGIAKQLFLQNGIPTPRGTVLARGQQAKDLGELDISLPCVVKPCCGGSSIGVSIARTQEELSAALAEAFRWEDTLVVEEYIEGREFSVGVISYQALPVIEIAPIEGFYDYKNKYKAGSAVETCPADLPQSVSEQMQRYAEQVARVLGLDTYSRSDFLLGKDGAVYCLEANTLPGMTPTSLLPQEAAAVGVSFGELCEKIIEISLKRYPN